MNGHLVQRGKDKKRWSLVIELGTDEKGKRKQTWKAFHGNKRDAQAELTRLVAEANSGLPIESSHVKVSAFLERYLEDHARLKVQPKTFERYAEHVHKHINPAIGHIPLGKLTPMHIQNFYTHLRNEGRLDGKGGLSERTILHMHNVLHSAFDCAVRWQAMVRNPVNAVDRPKPQRTEMNFLTEAEVVSLLAAAKNTSRFVLLDFALGTGMRRGEILGLRWQDVDLDKSSVSVLHSLEQTRGGPLRLKTPKTKQSRRRVTLPPYIVQRLRGHKAIQAKERMRFGESYQNNDLVFCRADGSFLPPDQLSGFFKKFATTWGRPEVRFHDLRHTHASSLLLHNVHPKVVSERLGHASIGITLDTYSHVVPTMQEDAARCMQQAFGNAAG